MRTEAKEHKSKEDKEEEKEAGEGKQHADVYMRMQRMRRQFHPR